MFNVPVLAPSQDGAFGDVHTTTLILVAMAAALAATALVQLLMLGTLRPLMFFGWIVALVTAIAVAFPFGTTALLDAKQVRDTGPRESTRLSAQERRPDTAAFPFLTFLAFWPL